MYNVATDNKQEAIPITINMHASKAYQPAAKKKMVLVIIYDYTSLVPRPSHTNVALVVVVQ